MRDNIAAALALLFLLAVFLFAPWLDNEGRVPCQWAEISVDMQPVREACRQRAPTARQPSLHSDEGGRHGR